MGALADNPAAGDAVNVRYQNHANLAVPGDINYDLRTAADVLNLAKTKAKLEDPFSDAT